MWYNLANKNSSRSPPTTYNWKWYSLDVILGLIPSVSNQNKLYLLSLNILFGAMKLIGVYTGAVSRKIALPSTSLDWLPEAGWTELVHCKPSARGLGQLLLWSGHSHAYLGCRIVGLRWTVGQKPNSDNRRNRRCLTKWPSAILFVIENC